MHPQIRYTRGVRIKVNVRRLILFSFLFVFILFSACRAEDSARKNLVCSLSAIYDAEYTAKITANFPTRETSFTINYSYTPELSRASVISPEDVKGISYSVNGENASLEFDGAILEIGKLSEGGISPFSCIGDLLNSWKVGDFSEVSRSSMYGKDALLAISRLTEEYGELEYRTWFSKDEFLPLYSEIFSDGARIIQCEFERSIHNRR